MLRSRADRRHRTRPRIGVPAVVVGLRESTGAGRIWHRVLPVLERSFEVRVVDDPAAGDWRPDVWLTDGHNGPLPVPEPVVIHLHEAAWNLPELRPLYEDWFVEAYEGPSAEASRRAARIITPSSSSRDQIVAAGGIDSSKVHVVHHGVDNALFRPGRRRPRELLAGAGCDPERPYVLYASVIHPRKNLTALREAMVGLARRGLPHGLVLIAAAPPDRLDPSALEAEAVADLPGAPARVARFTDLGDDDVAALMANASAFCLPSLMEGFGFTALEAMAAGVPVVVSDRGSLPEVVGDAGIVVPPTGDAVEEALARVLTDPAEARVRADAGRRRALELNWERCGRGWRGAVEAAITPAA